MSTTPAISWHASPPPPTSKLCIQTFPAGRGVQNHLSTRLPCTPLIIIWMREQNVSSLPRATSKAAGHILSPSLTSESVPSYFICNQRLTLSLASFDLFCWESRWLRAFFASKTDSLFIQTNRMFFIPIHSWALPLTLPRAAAALPERRRRREGRAGGICSCPNRVASAFAQKISTLQKKINEQQGLNKMPHSSLPLQEAVGLTDRD